MLRDAWSASVKRRSEAGYLALRLAAILEGHAYECASLIQENGMAFRFQGPDDQYPPWNAKLPDLPPFPEEKEGWHSIDLRLATRVLDLRNHLAGSQGVISATVEYAEESLGDEIDEHAAARGQEAWDLASDLRKRYGLPAFVPVWDFTDALERARKSAQKAKEEGERAQAELMQHLEREETKAP
jgi:hypothetical protein